MHSFRIILYLGLTSGLLFTGCTSRQSDQSSAEKEINQFNKAGEKEGPWEIYQDSVLVAKGSYRDGEPDGLWTYWYPAGGLKEEGNYNHGIKTSIWSEWYQDGDLMWKGEYENGGRHIGYPDAKVEIEFIGDKPGDNVLVHDHTYKMRIRIPNIPSYNLFVETSKGSIKQGDEFDIFILETPSDTSITLAIGYIQSDEFKDFRSLVSEVQYKIR